MKKKLLAIVIMVIMLITLTACGKKSIEGSWVLTKAYSGDQEVTQEQLQQQGIGGTTFVFKDGKVTITTTASDEVSEGTYTLDGDKVTFGGDGEDQTFSGTFKDDTLTVEQNDAKLVFERK